MTTPLPVTHDDDVAHLRQFLQQPELTYVDFSARRQLEQSRQRWPLLDELNAAAAGAR